MPCRPLFSKSYWFDWFYESLDTLDNKDILYEYYILDDIDNLSANDTFDNDD